MRVEQFKRFIDFMRSGKTYMAYKERPEGMVLTIKGVSTDRIEEYAELKIEGILEDVKERIYVKSEIIQFATDKTMRRVYVKDSYTYVEQDFYVSFLEYENDKK